MMRSRAGLYLSDERLTVVVATGGREGVQGFTLDPGEFPGTRLKTELDTRQLHPHRMRIGFARPLLTVKILELPPAAHGQVSEMVAFELERHVPFPPEDMRFDYVELPGASKGPLRILVAACERRTLEGALRVLEEPRLKPAAVTIASHDLPALLARRPRLPHLIWAHRAAGATDLVCLSHGRVELSRTVPVKDGAELADEVASTFRLLGWAECDAIWISGDDATEVLAAPALTEFNTPVTEPPWKPSTLALIQKLPEENFGAAMLALGVALGSKRPALNLLPRELRPRTLSTEQKVTLAMAALAGALGLGLLAGQGAQQHRYANRLGVAIRALDPEVKSVEALSAELVQKKRLLETIQGIEKNNVRTLPILKELTERIPPEAWLRTFTMDKQGLELTGQASAANQLIPLLDNSPWLERVEFTAPVTKAGDKEQFRIKAAWKNAPKPAEPAPKPATPAPPPRASGTRAPQPGPAGR